MIDAVIDNFVASQKRLLEFELNAEQDEHDADNRLKPDGDVPQTILQNLEAVDVSVGLLGRTVVTLQSILSNNISPALSSPDDLSQNLSIQRSLSLLPAHRFTVGDEIEILSKHRKFSGTDNAKMGVVGVVSAVTDGSISIALFSRSNSSEPSDKDASTNGSSSNDDETDLLGSPPLSIIPRSSIQVHKKIISALDELRRYGVSHPIAGSVVRSLFTTETSVGLCSSELSSKTSPTISPFSANLDDGQISAVQFVLSNEYPIALIHGPPGTGKTTTVAELIKQAVHVCKWKVLVTAPSNVAVDNILDRLISRQNVSRSKATRKDRKLRNRDCLEPIRAIRLGHPARIKENMLPYSLEYLVQKAEGTEIVQDIRSELQMHLKLISSNDSKLRGLERRSLFREVKALRNEVRMREEKVVRDLIDSYAQVVLATNVGAATSLLDKVVDGFDLVIIDEAAQAMEATCWIPILRGKRLVLAGDHCQLPPTIISSKREVQLGLGKTLFERIINMYSNYGLCVSRMLQVQYRMNEMIANWASRAMYSGKLFSHDSVKARRLDQLCHVDKIDISKEDSNVSLLSLAYSPMVLIDTSGCELYEMVNSSGSRYNDGEADIVQKCVRNLFRIGLSEDDIAIISPYNGQVFLLRNLLLPEFPKLEIRSVDGFQGGEKEAVILSLVRSSDKGGEGGIGFLKDNRRLNVAITRAKRHCAVICDSETVSQHPFLKCLIEYIQDFGEHVSAMEFYSARTLTTANVPSHVISDRSKTAPSAVQNNVDFRSDVEVPDWRMQMECQVSENHIHSSVLRAEYELSRVNDQPSATMTDSQAMDSFRSQLLTFRDSSTKDEKMIFDCHLSKFQRRLIHQLCEELGLGHLSEGVDGIDRKIVVYKVKVPTPVIINHPNTELFRELPSNDDKGLIPISKDASAAALISSNNVNTLLADLHKARAARTGTYRSKLLPQQQSNTANTSSISKSKESPSALDDMSYLDAEILKVQTSHGRKLEGSGKMYKTIVNGILCAQPKPVDVKRSNPVASAVLSKKIKESQEKRKSKKK